jgi:hypothetical protein
MRTAEKSFAGIDEVGAHHRAYEGPANPAMACDPPRLRHARKYQGPWPWPPKARSGE